MRYGEEEKKSRKGRKELVRVEGKGLIAPSPVKISLDDEEVRFIRSLAQRLAAKNHWNFKNCFLGELGEAAYAKYVEGKSGIPRLFNGRVYNRHGDGGIDIEVMDVKVQVKTHYKGNRCRLRRITENQELKALVCDIFAFAEVPRDSLNLPCIDVFLLGWIKTDDLEKFGKLEGSKKRGFYTVIKPELLLPVIRLAKRLKNEAYLDKLGTRKWD